MNDKSRPSFTWLLPFILVLLLFIAFVVLRIPGIPEDLTQRGAFGDSFGVLNTLFTGLGFAGLLVTLMQQQRQISQQSREFQQQIADAALSRYEENLFRLLSLYNDSLASVINTRDGRTVTARTALRDEIDRMLKAVRQANLGRVPDELARRYRQCKLTAEDEQVLQYLCYGNAKLISAMVRQGRLISSLLALLSHLEDGAPTGVDVSRYRRIVGSQITHLELTYFLYISLVDPKESELRGALQKSGLAALETASLRLYIHRIMYSRLWGIDLREGRGGRRMPMSSLEVRSVRRSLSESKNALRRMLGSND